MSDLYLTIDDSPSANFPHLCAYLKEHNIPAIFFVRGDLLSLYPNEIIEAIKDGFVIANHSWSHHRASKLGASLAIKEVLKTQSIIDNLYAAADVPCPGPYMRFPYMDAGLGGWPLPANDFSPQEQFGIEAEYAGFYGNDMAHPDDVAITRFQQIQKELWAKGYRQMCFKNIGVPWYKTYADSEAISTQGTFCHPDWVMHGRYQGKIADAQRSIAVLNKNFDDYVSKNAGAHIIVMHDSIELWPVTKALIDHMISGEHKFLPIPV